MSDLHSPHDNNDPAKTAPADGTPTEKDNPSENTSVERDTNPAPMRPDTTGGMAAMMGLEDLQALREQDKADLQGDLAKFDDAHGHYKETVLGQGVKPRADSATTPISDDDLLTEIGTLRQQAEDDLQADKAKFKAEHGHYQDSVLSKGN